MLLQVRGLCLGMMAGTATYATAFAGVWLFTDWDKEAAKAAVRAGVSQPLLAPEDIVEESACTREDASAAVDIQ